MQACFRYFAKIALSLNATILLNIIKNFNPTDKRNTQKFHKKIMHNAKKVRLTRTFPALL